MDKRTNLLQTIPLQSRMRFARIKRKMGRADDPVRCQERMSLGKRLAGKHIEPGSGNLAPFERSDQGHFIDQTSPRDIDQDRSRFHLCQFIGTDQSRRLIG